MRRCDNGRFILSLVAILSIFPIFSNAELTDSELARIIRMDRDIRELQAGSPLITGFPTFQNTITFSSGIIVGGSISGWVTENQFNAHVDATSVHGAASANTASRLVIRDASGNFAAGTITAALTGNAATASALAANGSNCSAGSAPLGVDAYGAVEGCWAVMALGAVDPGYINLSTVTTALNAKVSTAGDSMTGPLIMYGSSLTIRSTGGSENIPLKLCNTTYNPGCGYAVWHVVADDGSYTLWNNQEPVFGSSSVYVYIPNDIALTRKFGVGTETPATKLDVWGNAQFGSWLALKSTFSTTGALTLASNAALTLKGADGFITGVSSVNSSAFFGNGAGLTALAAAQLVGAVPTGSVDSSTLATAIADLYAVKLSTGIQIPLALLSDTYATRLSTGGGTLNGALALGTTFYAGNGRVGIGLTNPSNPLSVYWDGSLAPGQVDAVRITQPSGGSLAGGIAFYDLSVPGNDIRGRVGFVNGTDSFGMVHDTGYGITMYRDQGIRINPLKNVIIMSTLSVRGEDVDTGYSVDIASGIYLGGCVRFGDATQQCTAVYAIADGSIDTDKLATDAVSGVKILNGSVDTNKIATDAVVNAKILTGSIDTRTLAADAVSNAKILNGAVDTNKLATDAVSNTKILNGAVNTAKLGQSGCVENEILKWNGTYWACAVDAGAGGGGDVYLANNQTFTGKNEFQNASTFTGTAYFGSTVTMAVGSFNVGIGTTSHFAIKLNISQTEAGQMGVRVLMPTSAETTQAGIRVFGYSPAIELLDKDAVQNWYIGIDDNDSNKFLIGRGYGPGQSIVQAVTIDTADNMGIGTATPASRLDLGSGCMTGSLCSDIRLKRNIEFLPEDRTYLTKVLKLQGVSFEWSNSTDTKRYFGLISQEVEKVLPEVVMISNSKDHQKGLLCLGLEAVLIEAIKEQQKEIEEMKAKLAELAKQ